MIIISDKVMHCIEPGTMDYSRVGNHSYSQVTGQGKCPYTRLRRPKKKLC